MKSLMTFLLIQLHHASCLETNTKENGVKKLHNHSLISYAFDTHFGISWDDCLQKCKDIRKCKSINYMRRSGFCELNNGDQKTNPDALQTRVGFTFSSKHDWQFEEPDHCTPCSDGELCSSDQDKQCEIIGCPPPPPVAGAEILGNLFNVGTKRLYRCSNGVRQVSVCQTDGSWSPVNITCSCGEIEIKNANYTITETDDGLIEAIIVCAPGYFHYNVSKIQCDSSTLIWNNLEQVRCVKSYAEPWWTLVFRTTQEGGETFTYSWGNARVWLKGEIRNDEIVGNWSNMSIKQVKVDIVNVSDNVVATLVFNGAGSNERSWFRRRKLINSSWTDLKSDLKTKKSAVFSPLGLNSDRFNNTKEDSIYLRWAILNYEINAENIVSIDCSKSLVWLTIITAGNHPCDERLGKLGERQLIIFSNSANGTTWKGGKLELAKELRLYVWLDGVDTPIS